MNNKGDTPLVETFDPEQEGRAMAQEVIGRIVVWIADARTHAGLGLRATVVLYCVRPDLIDGATLEEIGEQYGCTRQLVHKLVSNFRLSIGLVP